tara:strand:+ start:3139 stop:5241 length:2103 start_codon:yes stop_codon:yes gene_type:complete
MAAFNITADPQMGDYVSLSPDSLRRQRIDVLAEKIFASMTPAQTYKLGQQRGGPDTSAGRGDSSRTIALKQAIAQEQSESAAAPTIASETVGAATAPDFDALDRSVGALDTTKEAASFLPTAPAPTIASETTGAAKPTATGLTGDQLTQRILDQDAALVAQEAKNPLSRLPAAPAPAAQAMPTTGTAPVDEPRKSLLERLAPNVFGNLNRSAADDVTGNIAEAVDPSKFSAGGLSREEYYQRSVDQAKGRVGTGMFGFGNDGQDDVDSAQERLDKFRFYEEEPTEDESASAGVPRVSQNPPAPSASDLMRASAENTVGLGAATPPDVEEILRPQNKFTPQEQLDVPDDVDAMGMDLEGMAPPEKAGLLSRLGGFAQNNPELLAQIAQAGGGFMQDIAQGRAQKKADAKTRGAMAQSNLIGALTGGKSRPAVMREEAEQGGLLARLGQAVEIGGSVAGGEMKRRTALSQRGEEMDLKGRKVAAGERQGDLMSKRLGIMQDKINKEYEINNKAAQVALAEATGASYERVQGGIESLNKATNIYKGGGYLDPTQGAKNLYGQMRVLYNDYDKDATPANVGAIFQVYQRFFDPATVREGDLKILQEAEGTFRRIQARAERLVGAGGSLSSDTVEEMKRITDKVHSMQARKATEDVNAYISTALDPRDREATSEYYDRIFKMPSLSDSGDKGDLVKDLGQTEIKL